MGCGWALRGFFNLGWDGPPPGLPYMRMHIKGDIVQKMTVGGCLSLSYLSFIRTNSPVSRIPYTLQAAQVLINVKIHDL